MAEMRGAFVPSARSGPGLEPGRRPGLMETPGARGTSMSYVGKAPGGFRRSKPVEIVDATRVFLSGLLLACALASCSPDTAPVNQASYATKIVGGWQGTVGDNSETIKFDADGNFVSELRPRGF